MDEFTAKILTEPFRRTQLFAGASDEIIAKLAAATVRVSFKRNELIVREGDPGDRMFLLVEGAARVMVGAPDGETITLATLEPSDSFGELSLLDGLPRSATVQALDSPTVAFALSRELFLDVLHNDPRFVELLLKTFTATVKRLTDTAADIAFLGVTQRMARFLLQQSGGKPAAGAVVDLSVKKVETQLAAMLGRSVQGVAQMLSDLEKRGGVEIDGSRLIIRDPEVLREIALGPL